jgi:hypothetical protein
MRRLLLSLAIALAAAALSPSAAGAAFGLHNYDVTFTEADGSPAQAGSHPFAVTTSFEASLDSGGTPEGWFRNIFLAQIPGLAADTTAYPRCSNADFLAIVEALPSCPLDSVVGITAISANDVGSWFTSPVFNLTPPPGVLLRLGFSVVGANIVIDVGLNEEHPFNAIAASRNTSQVAEFIASKTQLWGDPSDPRHDELRGVCGFDDAISLPGSSVAEFEFQGQGKSCPVKPRTKPLLTMPTDCSAPLRSSYQAFSWPDFDGVVHRNDGFVDTHDAGGNPAPLAGCESLPAFSPSIGAAPTSRAASSPTGLDFTLAVKDEGLTAVGSRSQSRIKKVVLTLPEGMTVNPSLAEGLAACSIEQLAAEKLNSAPGAGCPPASKIGTVEARSPLVEEHLTGSLFVAEPFDNLADDSLIALYIVLKNPDLGVIVKQATRVEPDPRTGQLKGIAEDVPQLPFAELSIRFREGGRSPLITPPLCGTYRTVAEITPSSGAPPALSTSSFEIVTGPNGGPCPAGGTPPFEPGFGAGSLNNSAGAFSPFAMRLTRRDGDQDLTRFDATLPPGVLGKLAGLSQCSGAQIAAAKAKTGSQERQSPSCPANSKIGGIQAGAGVGSQLTYVPGSLYLAGPFAGAPLSAVGIVPAVAGPFDVGTVVVRQALDVDPRNARVSVDGAKSDPIPHILAGIPLAVRDIQVSVDRPRFTLNPTGCDPSATLARIWGGGADPFSLLDDSPVQRQARYQASSCMSLPFGPRLSMALRGGTKRGAHPAFRGVLRPRPGDANLERLVARLPRSAFLDQGHIRTICTRVQFAADKCPAASIYGRARAFTPLLTEPLEGPVYLRSSDNDLPDLVIDLHGLVDFEAVARVDSIRGGIRVTFASLPDAPLTKAVLNMQGGRKGLIQNSADLCAATHRAKVTLDAHNGKRRRAVPAVRARCGKRG